MLDTRIHGAKPPEVGANLLSRHDRQPGEVFGAANLPRVHVVPREELAVVRDVLGGVGDCLADSPVSVLEELLPVAKRRPLLPRECAGDRDHSPQPAH